MLVYSERLFLDYNPYYQFSSHELLQIIQHDCKLFENILDEVNPDFLLINGVDFHRNYLISEICKSRGIKVLMLFSSRLGYRCMISSGFDEFDKDLPPKTRMLCTCSTCTRTVECRKIGRRAPPWISSGILKKSRGGPSSKFATLHSTNKTQSRKDRAGY